MNLNYEDGITTVIIISHNISSLFVKIDFKWMGSVILFMSCHHSWNWPETNNANICIFSG